jgi:Acetyltransferase (GNAT) family
MRVERRSGLELSKWQMRDLSVLNLSDGNMWPELVARRRDKRECTVYLARADSTIVGWALTYPTPNLGGHDFHVYVSEEGWRRMGYGTALHRAASADFGQLRMFAPDENARKFHASLDMTPENG